MKEIALRDGETLIASFLEQLGDEETRRRLVTLIHSPGEGADRRVILSGNGRRQTHADVHRAIVELDNCPFNAPLALETDPRRAVEQVLERAAGAPAQRRWWELSKEGMERAGVEGRIDLIIELQLLLEDMRAINTATIARETLVAAINEKARMDRAFNGGKR